VAVFVKQEIFLRVSFRPVHGSSRQRALNGALNGTPLLLLRRTSMIGETSRRNSTRKSNRCLEITGTKERTRLWVRTSNIVEGKSMATPGVFEITIIALVVLVIGSILAIVTWASRNK